MNKIQAHVTKEIISSNASEAHALHKKSCFGKIVRGKIQYSLPETLFLMEKKKIEIFSGNKKYQKKN